MPSFKEFDCQRERFVNAEAANLTKLLQPFVKTLVAQLLVQPVRIVQQNYGVPQDESYWNVLVELKPEFQADARWLFPYALRRHFRILDELKCKCAPKDVFRDAKMPAPYGRQQFPWYVGFEMSRP